MRRPTDPKGDKPSELELEILPVSVAAVDVLTGRYLMPISALLRVTAVMSLQDEDDRSFLV
jgi:hypothetical protein